MGERIYVNDYDRISAIARRQERRHNKMKLILNDKTEVQIQAVALDHDKDTELAVLHIRLLYKGFDELEAIFSDPSLTQRMMVREPGIEDKAYEGYTGLKSITKEAGGIFEVALSQDEKPIREQMAALKEAQASLKEAQAAQAEGLRSASEKAEGAARDAEASMQAARDAGAAAEASERAAAEAKAEAERMAEQGGAIDMATYSAAVMVARASAQAFTDEAALEAKAIYCSWEDLAGRGFVAKEAGYKFTYDNALYKTAQENITFRPQYVPGEGTESLYTCIDEAHAGTLEDPIPAAANMEYIKGRYYVEGGQIYLMNRAGMEDGEGIVLQHLPSALIGHYFEIVP